MPDVDSDELNVHPDAEWEEVMEEELLIHQQVSDTLGHQVTTSGTTVYRGYLADVPFKASILEIDKAIPITSGTPEMRRPGAPC